MFKGSYLDDLRQGYGEMYWSDGLVYKGNWDKGMQHGLGRLELPDDRVKEGIFKNNKYIGPQRQRDSLNRTEQLIQAILE